MGLETIAIGSILASTAIGAAGAIKQGNAASAAAGYNAQVAQRNAEIATQNANFTGAQGEQNVAAAGAETRARVAAITANEGASGVDLNSGSSVDVRQSEAKMGMLNALNIRSQAVRQAYGYQTDSANYTAQSKLDKMQGKAAKTAGYLNAGATVLSGIGKAASMYNPDSLGITGSPHVAGLDEGGYGPSNLPWQNTPTSGA